MSLDRLRTSHYDRSYHHDDDHDDYRYRSSQQRRRDRSRSRSPPRIDDSKFHMEAERRDRMARLRADHDEDDVDDEARPDRRHGNRQKSSQGTQQKPLQPPFGTNDDDDQDEDAERMAKLMGFSGFNTTKGQAVLDNATSAAKGAATKNKARKYRQYMNRKGGFNRALDKMP